MSTAATPSPATPKNQVRIVKLFIDNAKTYIQLSGGAIFLSVTFLHQVVGIQQGKPKPLDPWLVSSWGGFLLTILLGVLYQYVAVKFAETTFELPSLRPVVVRTVIRQPSLVYGLMMLSFYVGAILFTVGAVRRFM